MPKRLLIFDLDDTLLPELPPVHDAFAATAAASGCNARQLIDAVHRHAPAMWYGGPFADFGEQLGIAWWEAMSATFDGKGPCMDELAVYAADYRVRVWAAALSDCGRDDASTADRLAAQFPRERATRYIAYDGVDALLDQLRTDYRMAMLTNGPPDIQREKLERTGLTGRFDPLVISGDVGVGKPHVKVFEHLLAEAKADAADALMIGNSLTSDIAGANAARIESVWINHNGEKHTPTPADGKPDHVIASVTQLPDIVLR